MTKPKISPVSDEGHESPTAPITLERESGPARGDETDQDTSEDLVRELMSSVKNAVADARVTRLEHWKTELAEIASLAADIDSSLRRARDSMAGLLDSVDEIASRAFDAERSLRDAENRIHVITNTSR